VVDGCLGQGRLHGAVGRLVTQREQPGRVEQAEDVDALVTGLDHHRRHRLPAAQGEVGLAASLVPQLPTVVRERLQRDLVLLEGEGPPLDGRQGRAQPRRQA
jgi:hypothetical protein